MFRDNNAARTETGTANSGSKTRTLDYRTYFQEVAEFVRSLEKDSERWVSAPCGI